MATTIHSFLPSIHFGNNSEWPAMKGGKRVYFCGGHDTVTHTFNIVLHFIIAMNFELLKDPSFILASSLSILFLSSFFHFWIMMSVNSNHAAAASSRWRRGRVITDSPSFDSRMFREWNSRWTDYLIHPFLFVFPSWIHHESDPFDDDPNEKRYFEGQRSKFYWGERNGSTLNLVTGNHQTSHDQNLPLILILYSCSFQPPIPCCCTAFPFPNYVPVIPDPFNQCVYVIHKAISNVPTLKYESHFRSLPPQTSPYFQSLQHLLSDLDQSNRHTNNIFAKKKHGNQEQLIIYFQSDQHFVIEGLGRRKAEVSDGVACSG